MKKILYTIIAIFAMVACTDDHLIDIPTPPTEENGEKVEIKFSVQVPEAKAVESRTLTAPAIDNLYLVVFDAYGYLSETAKATPVNETFGLGSKVAPIDFTVTLSQTPNKRIVHFVAYDEIIPNGKTADPLTTALEAMKNGDLFGHESTLMTEDLIASGQQDVYWQRVEFTEGISINTIGNKMTAVPLIRNFAKITVALNKTEADVTSVTVPEGYKFELEGFMVVNTLTGGSVAPYNTNGGGFVNYVDNDNDKVPFSYSVLNGTYGYTGFVPNGIGLSDVNINEPSDGTASPYTIAAKYMYERNGQSQNTNRTFVIMKGKFGPTSATNTKSTYYKIDLTDSNGDYYEILRNFSYNIVIKGVEAEGKSSPSEAAGMTGSHNNLSTSIETQSLLNISDGVSRLFVNYTEYVFVTENETMELKYRYVPNIGSPDEEANGDIAVEWTAATDGSGAISSIERPVDDDGNFIGDDNAGWRTLVVTAGTVNALQTKEQTVTLTNGNNISRMVIFKLRPKFNFSNEKATSPDPAGELKATFTYSFSIPFGSAASPTIPESLFPLTFIVQATPENIYPDADENSLPVHVLDGQQTFGYEREVTWEEYQQTGGIINCYFRVNTTSYANTQITVSNKYFNDCEAVPLNDNNSTYAFSNLVVNGGDAVPYGTGRSVTFTFNMPYVATGGTDVTITANKMSAMSRATTFTYKANEAGTQTVTFTTGEFASADRIKLEAASYITAVKAYDNVLKIAANKLKSTLSLSNIDIYLDQTYTNKVGSCNFTASGNYLTEDINITNDALTADGYLYFKNEDGTCRASIAVSDLLDNTEDTLTFYDADGNIIKMFSNLSLTNANTFGKENVVTINFDMEDKTTPVKITIKEGTNTSTFYYTPTSDGDNSHSYEYTTLTWNGQISVELNATGYIKAFKEAEERIFNSPTIYMDSNGETFRNVTVTITDEKGNQIGTCYARRKWSNSSYVYYLDSFNFNDFSSLEISTKIVLTYTEEGGWYSDDTIYVTEGDITVGDIVNPSTDFKVKFVKQQ